MSYMVQVVAWLAGSTLAGWMITHRVVHGRWPMQERRR